MWQRWLDRHKRIGSKIMRKIFYVACKNFANQKIIKIHSMGSRFKSKKEVEDYLVLKQISNIYCYIPNSCVRKLIGSDTWEGVEYSN
jgi:hypothetical protein